MSKLNENELTHLCNECSLITNNDVSLYCDKCNEKHIIEKAKTIINSCTTQEHFDVAFIYLDQYLKLYSNSAVYKELIELISDRKEDINFNNPQ